jgi:hypothetical protein
MSGMRALVCLHGMLVWSATLVHVQSARLTVYPVASQAALTNFDDTNSKELEIEVVTQEVTRLFREAEKQLQRFGHQQSATAADDKVWRVCSVPRQTEEPWGTSDTCANSITCKRRQANPQHLAVEHPTSRDDGAAVALQVRRNVQRTLATELQNLSVQFRKQQKQHLNQLRQQKEGVSGSWLDAGPSGDPGDEYDPGFSDMQVRFAGRQLTMLLCIVGCARNELGYASNASDGLLRWCALVWGGQGTRKSTLRRVSFYLLLMPSGM